jgi:kynurenine formamidase
MGMKPPRTFIFRACILTRRSGLWKIGKFKAIGIDTASIDFGQSTEFKTHVTLMTNNIPAFENVAKLDKLPAKGFHVIAMPMKIKGGSGAPLRIAAWMPKF